MRQKQFGEESQVKGCMLQSSFVPQTIPQLQPPQESNFARYTRAAG